MRGLYVLTAITEYLPDKTSPGLRHFDAVIMAAEAAIFLELPAPAPVPGRGIFACHRPVARYLRLEGVFDYDAVEARST